MFLTILRDDALRKKMGDASIQVIRENRGAAVRTIGYLKELLRLTATESMVNTHYKISTRNINDEVSPRMRPGDAVTQYLIQLSHGEDNNVLDWLVLSCSASYPYFMKWGSPQTELLQSPSPADNKAGLLRHQHWQYYGWRYRKDPNRPESGSYDPRHGVPCRYFEPRLSVHWQERSVLFPTAKDLHDCL
mgnify:CR=1 FL=1